MEIEERLAKLEVGMEGLKQKHTALELRYTDLEKLHAQGMHDLNESRQEIQNLSNLVRNLNTMLIGSDDGLSPGLIKRFVATETFIEWIKGKKTLAFGFAIAVGAIGTFVWFLGDAIIRFVEIKKAIGK